jgi:hypothetical protein
MSRVSALEDIVEYTAMLVTAAYATTIGLSLATGHWGEPCTPMAYPLITLIAVSTVVLTIWHWED